MNLLEKVNILGLVHDVEYCKFDDRLQLNDYTGSAMARKQKIQIDSDSCKEHQELTLIHEILHMLSYQLFLEFDERTIKCLAIGLYQTLTENDFFGNRHQPPEDI
jgi:hypothetical protein